MNALVMVLRRAPRNLLWYPVVFAIFVLTLFDGLFWGVLTTLGKQIPYEDTLHLIWWSIDLPFEVSRIWDIFLGLASFFVVTFLFGMKSFFHNGETIDVDSKDPFRATVRYLESQIADVTAFATLLSLVCGFIFGAIHAIPTILVVYAIYYLSIPTILGILRSLAFLIDAYQKMKHRRKHTT